MDVGVIGGSRHFGRRVVRRLLDAGHRVTVINRGSTAPEPGAERLVADRDDAAGLRAALGARRFDVVIDQVCYHPVQARIAAAVFAGRTQRYVLTSTVEVYAASARARAADPVAETAVALGGVDTTMPWHEAAYLERHYGEGKRQAETVFTEQTDFAFTAVRCAHVLGGADFTGRLAHYLTRVRAGRPIDVHAPEFPATFIDAEEIAAFLEWTATADFTGPVNANAHGALTARQLCEYIPTDIAPRFREVAPAAAASPFSYATWYPMDNSRAEALGFGFSRLTDRLPRIIRDTLDER